MKAIVCSPENYAHWVKMACPGEGKFQLGRGELDGLPIVTDRFMPTWKEYQRPKWWRRWFLREKQKPRERVYFVMEYPI